MNDTASARSSRRSSIESNASGIPEFDIRPSPIRTGTSSTTSSTSTSSTRSHAIDALSREFPRPPYEPTVEELLARPSPRWSLGHYVKNARDITVPVQNKEQQAKAFADAKRELLRAKQEMMQVAKGGR